MDRCSTCTEDYCCVLGDGPVPTKIMCIGERPGQEENKRGVPFIGDAGREFNEHYLRLTGISRDDIYITNVVKCGADRNKKPTAKEIEVCGSFHLPGELKRVNPELVILMGASACSLAGDVDLEVVHGIPFKGEIYGWSGWVCCQYHPAAGLHNSSLMIPLMDDYRRLGGWLKNPKEHGIVKSTRYELARTENDIKNYFFGEQIDLIGVDTESQEGRPFSIQVCNSVGTGLMVYLSEKFDSTLEFALASQIERHHCLVLHNAPADLSIVEKLMSSWWLMPPYRDTMQEAYHFQNLPQKLKALAYHLLGHRRRSWDQVVGPPSKSRLQEWLLEAMIIAEGERTTEIERRFAKGYWTFNMSKDDLVWEEGRELKPSTKIIKSPFERTLSGIMTHTSKSETYDPWERITPEMEAKFGRAPRKGVKWVDEDELVEYACSDASDTLELALLFDKMREEIVKKEWNVLDDDCDPVEACSA